MRSSVLAYRLLSLLLVMLLLPMSAFAYVYDENVSYYESLPVVQEYLDDHTLTLTCYNVEGNEGRMELYQRCFDKLENLGYSTGDSTLPYYTYDSGPTISLFAQQMGLGDCENGWKMPPLYQAIILTDGLAQPAVVASVNHHIYCNKSQKTYSLKEITQAKQEQKVCWTGTVMDVQLLSGSKVYYTISCEGEAFIVEFTHPARSTTFLKNDNVIVYGRISGNQSVQIVADMIAYAK